MDSRFIRTVDQRYDEMPKTNPYFSKLSQLYEASGARYRVPLTVAILSVAFQEHPLWIGSYVKVHLYGRFTLDVLGAGLVLSSVLAAWARTSRLAVGLFIAIAALAILPDWAMLANHTYLALWSIPIALLFKDWWTSDLYAYYLRITLGIVMLAAFSQKILAGSYVDGSFIAWLSTGGSTTERLFSFLCDGTSTTPCIYYRAISIFILVWQLAVGILLLLGLNSLVFLAIEIGFLLGAGVYADEMNFQILNIALLCIVFRFGMPLWLLVGSVILLAVDVYRLSNLLNMVLSYAA
ncbi:hypothetical protein [Taklimakanibacter deserti]|uniref:hypothetical protein n=1 Tax=Taklimakanibacter deserti TaxID=2267839 RepID=UPI000E655D6D